MFVLFFVFLRALRGYSSHPIHCWKCQVPRGTTRQLPPLAEGLLMHRAILAFGLIVLPSYAFVHADDAMRLADVTALQAAMQKAIERAEPSIACIMVSRGNGKQDFKPEDPTFVPELYGSGVVIDPQG